MTATRVTTPAMETPSATDHTDNDYEWPSSVEGSNQLGVASAVPRTFTALRIFSEMFDDVQKARIACANRAERGLVDEALYLPQLDALAIAEKEMGKAMRAEYRRAVHDPIRQWQKNTVGIGEHLLARLLGAIGHPVHAQPHHWERAPTVTDVDSKDVGKRVLIADPPFDRTVAQLWAYCGHGDPTRKRRVGMSWEDGARLGSPRAKMIVHLLAESCMKQMSSPYRPIYEKARLEYDTREGWTKAHQHAAALRLVGKEILRDLWQVSG